MWKLKAAHKFKAVKTERKGISFPSKLEARYFDTLEVKKRIGEVVFFLRQVSFDLPGGVRYVADYQVFYADGSVEFVDVKGMDTPASKLKRKQVEELYPVEIKVVTNADF